MVTLIYEKLTSFSGNGEKYKSYFKMLCSHNHCLLRFLSARLLLFCNHQTRDNIELRETYLKLNLLLCFARQTVSKCPKNKIKIKIMHIVIPS